MARFKLGLDIDGPLNPYDLSEVEAEAKGYSVLERSTQMLRDRLNNSKARVYGRWLDAVGLVALGEELDAELIWVSMWNDFSNTYFGSEIGMPELPVVQMSHYDRRFKVDWKFGPILDELKDIPFAWFDDDFSMRFPEQQYFLEARGDTPTLLVDVPPNSGLENHHYDQVRKWAKELP